MAIVPGTSPRAKGYRKRTTTGSIGRTHSNTAAAPLWEFLWECLWECLWEFLWEFHPTDVWPLHCAQPGTAPASEEQAVSSSAWGTWPGVWRPTEWVLDTRGRRGSRRARGRQCPTRGMRLVPTSAGSQSLPAFRWGTLRRSPERACGRKSAGTGASRISSLDARRTATRAPSPHP